MDATVMIVDDAIFMRSILRGIMKDKGFTVVAEAASGIEAMKNFRAYNTDIIILDIILPDANGLDLLESILEARPRTKIVVCSSIGQEQIIKKALDHGAKAFIQKPFTPEIVLEVLQGLEA